MRVSFLQYALLDAVSFQKNKLTSKYCIPSFISICGHQAQGFYTSAKTNFNSTFWHFFIFRDFWELYDGAVSRWGVRGRQKFLWGIFGCCTLIPEEKIFGRKIFYRVIFLPLEVKKTRFLATKFWKSEQTEISDGHLSAVLTAPGSKTYFLT